MENQEIIKQIEFINEVHNQVIKEFSVLIETHDTPYTKAYNDGQIDALKYAIECNTALIEKIKTKTSKTN